MAWNIEDYVEEGIRALPVVLLLDTSGSMQRDLGDESKIDQLNQAVRKMMEMFQRECEMENFIRVTVYAFDSEARLIGQEQSEPGAFLQSFTPFTAQGMTYLGQALDLAKALIENREKTPGRWYRPSVILVSDGAPNGDWQEPLHRFLCEGRTVRTQRFAIAIGQEAWQGENRKILTTFAGVPENVFLAKEAGDIAEKFNLVTMSVSQRAASTRPDDFPTAEETAAEDIPRGGIVLPPRRRPAGAQVSRRFAVRHDKE